MKRDEVYKILIIFSVVLCLCAGCAKSENTSNTYLADAEIDSHVHVVNDESYKLLTQQQHKPGSNNGTGRYY